MSSTKFAAAAEHLARALQQEVAKAAWWKPANLWHRDAAFYLVEAFGWHWVERWSFRWAAAIADEATFQVARTLNRSRADSPAARMRWWRVYSAFPEIYRESAAKVWDREVTNARKRV